VSTSLNVVLTNNPADTDLVCFGGQYYNASGTPPGTFTVADANSKTYTKSTNAPSSAQASAAGFAYSFYLNNASGASKTITATFSSPGSSGSVEIFADDFTVSGGTSAYDQDTAGSGVSGTTINTPTVVRSGSGELLWGIATVANLIFSVNSPWTQGAIGGHGNATGYILSASADTAFNMTQGSAQWDSIGMAFTFSASGGGGSSSLLLLPGNLSGGGELAALRGNFQ
jgi:hypothetical protein